MIGSDIDEDTPELVREINMRAQELSKAFLQGDDSHVQRILFAQLRSTDSMFYRMLARMEACSFVEELKAYGNLAHSFQNQARRTAATLADLRNPKQTMVQVNAATNQQVIHEAAVIGTGTRLEAVGEIHGTKVRRR